MTEGVDAKMDRTITLVAGDLDFPEVPRWDGGRLWFSDRSRVMAMDATGAPQAQATLPCDLVLGRARMSDRSLLVNDVLGRRVFRLGESGEPTVYADLSDAVPIGINEIAVRRDGVAYVGPMGFSPALGQSPVPTRLVKIDPDGSAEPVGDEVLFPNGLVLTDDDATLLVAESFAGRISAFTVEPDGSLSGRRVVYESQDSHPDGICVDREGAIWYGDPHRALAVRVSADGQELERISPDIGIVTAVALGGPDGRTLFMTGGVDMPSRAPANSSSILATRVEVGAAER